MFHVSAERPLYSMDGEKTIYNVSEDPSIQTGTTNDALQNAPGVEVDVEGNITLRGVSSVEIWLNDKPSKLTSENLKTFLETLPANALARIETITNPSAKYATDADAVINIVTNAHIKSNQFVSFGLNGSSQPSFSPWISYVWSKEQLRINFSASGRYSYGLNEGSSWGMKYRDAQHDTLISVDSSSSSSHNSNLGGNLSLQISYAFDTSADVDIWVNGNISKNNSESQLSSLSDESYNGGYRNSYSQTSRNYIDNPLQNWNVMPGFAFTKKFKKEGQNLRIFSFNNYSASTSYNYLSREYEMGSNPLLNSFERTTETGFTSTDMGLRGRYNHPINDNLDLTFGINTGYKLMDKHYTPTYTLANGLDSIDPLRAYLFHDEEYEAGCDLGMTRRWGNLTLELGMGVNYKNLHFAYDASSPQARSSYPFLFDDTTYSFLTFQPSIYLSYRTESMHNMKVNYSLRMHTPGEEKLTTFRHYSDDSWNVGNRNLTPYYTHQAEAGWSKYFNRFGNVGIDGYLNYSTNTINDLTDITDGVDYYLNRVVAMTMPYNMGMSYRYGLTAHMMYRPSGFFNIRFYGNIYQSGYEMFYEKQGTTVSDNMLSYSLRANMWAKVLNNYQVHASINYSSPTLSLFATRKARYSFDLGLRSDFFKRKLSVFVNVRDLFNWGKTIGSGNTTNNPYYVTDATTRTINSRYISAGLTVRFGKMELERTSTSNTSTSDESTL